MSTRTATIVNEDNIGDDDHDDHDDPQDHKDEDGVNDNFDKTSFGVS